MLVSWWARELAAGENQPLANLPADWYLVAFPLHTVLTKILRFTQDDGGRREEIEAAPVMGWPLDSVILNAVKNLGAWRG